MATKIRWWIRPGDHMLGITHEQQVEAIELAWSEIEQVCDVEFERQSRESRARVEIRLESNLGYLGLSGRHGRIRISADRNLNLTGIWKLGDTNLRNRYPITIVQHEFHHTFGGDHIHDFKECYMHAGLGFWMCRGEALQLQRRYGEPGKIFHPVRRQHQGFLIRELENDLAALQDLREQYLEERATLPTKELRQEAHRRVLANLREQSDVRAVLSQRVEEWKAIQRSWNGVPGIRS